MILKQVIHDAATNSVEATWVDRIETYRLIEGETNVDGSPAQQRVITDRQVKCHSYADVQMDMLEADLGADLPAYATLIASVRAAIVPYVAPPPPPLPPVSPRQIRQALTRASLRIRVEAAVTAGNQDMKDWYGFSTEFERLHPQVTAMGVALGVSVAQLDALWTTADTL